MKQKKIKNKLISIIALYAFLLNFIWEMVQMPFYVNMDWGLQSTVYCFAASIGDVFMILIIFFIVGYLVKNKNWLLSFNRKNILFTLFAGLLLSLIVEGIGIRLSMWNYTDLMPELLLLNIGIVPVLQMLVLPILTFKLSAYTIRNLTNRKSSS